MPEFVATMGLQGPPGAGGGAAAGTYGDGADGVVHYAANTTLTRDVRATSVLVDAGVSVDVAGFEITATISITNNGVIHQNGKDGVSGAGGGAGGFASCAPLGCTAGVSGGNGGGGTSNPGNTSTILGAANPNVVHDTLGARGGNGGGSGATAGGLGADYTGYTVRATVPHPFAGPTPTRVLVLDPWSFGFAALSAGGGGGGGALAGGGGGGGGAGIVRLRAPSIINNGTIRARGGNGGAGGPVNGGGGGGGGGGRIVLVGALSGVGTTDVSGGAGGAGNGVGLAGAAGNAGTVHLFS